MPKSRHKERKLRLALVIWHDAFDGNPGWVDLETYKPTPMQPYSVGWLIPDFMEGHITLMGSFMVDYNDNKEVHYSTPSHIPVGMVQSITYLDVPDNIKDVDD
jgi:hypothetical protein